MAQMLLGGCTICGGSGYVPAYEWQDTSAWNPQWKPSEPNVLVPCNCLRARWRQERAPWQGTGRDPRDDETDSQPL